MSIVGAAVACGAVWDFITIFVGFADMFDVFSQEGDYPLAQLLFSLVATCVIMGFTLSTEYIWSNRDGDVITSMLKATWLLCFIFNIWTALLGNRSLLFGGRADDVKSVIAIGVVTIIITVSTIYLSRLLGEKRGSPARAQGPAAEAATVSAVAPTMEAPAAAPAADAGSVGGVQAPEEKNGKSYLF